MGVVLLVRQLQYLPSRRSAGAGACLLAKEALEDQAGRAVRHKVAFFSTEEAARRSSIHLTAGRVVERWFFAVVLVEVASGSRSGRRWSSGCSSQSRDSSQGVDKRIRGFVSSNLLVGLFKVFLEDPDLVLHGVDQALHFGVCLLLEDFFDPSGGWDDFFHCSVSQLLNLCG